MEEPQIIFEDFIGHYKGFFKDGNIDEFFEYWNFAEKVVPDSIRNRRETDDVVPYTKADAQV